VAGQGAALVDLLPAFKAARAQALYLPADGHPTAAANRLAARAVATWLEDRWHDGAARTD
jgi:lysophospholipase L1-like esterase